MDQTRGWGVSRYVALLVVLALHLAFFAALMMGSRVQSISLSADYPVELLYLPPPSTPKVRFKNSRPKSLSGNTLIALAPPVLDATSPSPAPAAAASNGSGPGVDWKAEARRAVQAFEIRNHEPEGNFISGSPAEDWWWPKLRHAAGEHYKTASGDWIVWINSSCYQVAVAGASPYAPGGLLPKTFCPGEADASRGEAGDPSAESQKASPKN